MAGCLFQYGFPALPSLFRELLSLLAGLHAYPHVGLRCILEIEILFNHLSLQLLDLQSYSEHWRHDTIISIQGMSEDDLRENMDSAWSSKKREASPEQSLRPSQAPPVDQCGKFLMKLLGVITTTGNNTMVTSGSPTTTNHAAEITNIDVYLDEQKIDTRGEFAGEGV